MRQKTLIPLMDRGRVDNVLFWAGMGFASHPLSPEELTIKIESAVAMGYEIVFPSHFFDYDHQATAVERIRQARGRFSIQISPGAELAQFLPQLLEPALLEISPGVELLMDRPLHEIDLLHLKKLQAAGIRIDSILCPTREFDPAKTYLSLPDEIRLETRFYFAPKRSRTDRFLDSDEIILAMRTLRDRGVPTPLPMVEYLRLHEPSLPIETRSARTLRQQPDEAFYFREFPELESHNSLRKLLRLLFSTAWLRWLGMLLFYSTFLLLSPASALQDLWGRLRAILVSFYWKLYALGSKLLGGAEWVRGQFHALRTRGYWRGVAFFGLLWIITLRLFWLLYSLFSATLGAGRALLVWTYWRVRGACGQLWALMVWLYWRMRGTLGLGWALAIRLYWRVRGAFGLGWTLLIRAYWKTYSLLSWLFWRIRGFLHHLAHPVWTLRTWAPPLYWIFVFPIQKSWWFTRYQFQRRILGRVAE